MNRKEIMELCDRHNIFPVVGKINADMMHELKEKLFIKALSEPNATFYILFDTPGGSVVSSKSVYDCLKALSLHTIGVVIGECSSAGLILLAGCTERLSFKHSRFLFHAITTHIEIKSTENQKEKFDSLLKEHLTMCEEARAIQIKEFGIQGEIFDTLVQEGEYKDRCLFADEAVEYGVIHKIIDVFPLP